VTIVGEHLRNPSTCGAMQTIRMHRPRIAPMWKAGLRRGKPRNSTMLLLQQHPEYEARLRRARERVLAWGVVPQWEHVKEPFDYDRR
jgi:hypothetical protein